MLGLLAHIAISVITSQTMVSACLAQQSQPHVWFALMRPNVFLACLASQVVPVLNVILVLLVRIVQNARLVLQEFSVKTVLLVIL